MVFFVWKKLKVRVFVNTQNSNLPFKLSQNSLFLKNFFPKRVDFSFHKVCIFFIFQRTLIIKSKQPINPSFSTLLFFSNAKEMMTVNQAKCIFQFPYAHFFSNILIEADTIFRFTELAQIVKIIYLSFFEINLLKKIQF